jgi:hypothetical protein
MGMAAFGEPRHADAIRQELLAKKAAGDLESVTAGRARLMAAHEGYDASLAKLAQGWFDQSLGRALGLLFACGGVGGIGADAHREQERSRDHHHHPEGDEQTADERRAALEPFRLDEELLSHAGDEAIALHCLPAHPGEEISAELLYGKRQRIWDQAENRRHAQKALLEWLLAAH